MHNLLTGMHNKNGNKWENNYYDDMEWLAIACIRAYEATKDAKFNKAGPGTMDDDQNRLERCTRWWHYVGKRPSQFKELLRKRTCHYYRCAIV